MDKKSKEALRRYKKARAASSSSSSSSSDSSSSSYSSSSSKKKAHRRKKPRSARRSSSSSDEERTRAKKRDKHACHKKLEAKLEAKRNHLRKKLKEAKLKKRAVSPSGRRRSVTPPHKVKKLVPGSAEKKHHSASSKERLMRDREREREKLRVRDRERGRSRSPKNIKIRVHPDVKRKSPASVSRHQLLGREKIIIQTRRDRSPSERKRELKVRVGDSRERERRDRERDEREAARNKDREEALARCQERQRERERLARENIRREKSKEYERGPDRLLPRPAEREMAIAAARGFDSRERSLEPDLRGRHMHPGRPVRDELYDRERDFVEHRERDERHEMHERDRDYVVVRRREIDSSPGPAEHFSERIREREREIYPEDERIPYARPYEGVPEEHNRERNWDHGEHEMRREHDHGKYPTDRPILGSGPHPRDWKPSVAGGDDWHGEPHSNWQRGKKPIPAEAGHHPGSHRHPTPQQGSFRPSHPIDYIHERPLTGPGSRDWKPSAPGGDDWHGEPHSNWQRGKKPAHAPPAEAGHHTGPHRHPTPQQGSFRPSHPIDYIHERPSYRHHPPPLMQQHTGGPTGFHHPRPHFPSKRQMTYTNPNLLKNKPATATSTQKAPPASTVKTPTDTIIAAEPSLKVEEKSETAAVKPELATTGGESIEKKSDVEEVIPDDLSEISDGDDEILAKEDEKLQESLAADEISSESQSASVPAATDTIAVKADGEEDTGVDDELLGDFEEISDGELEEFPRNKGVFDALGVDWASLVEETKLQEIAMEQHPTHTSKEKWQPHRVLLDVGISVKMAGEEAARKILEESKRQLYVESGKPKIKRELKDEGEVEEDATGQDLPGDGDAEAFTVHPIACIQVAKRREAAERNNLIRNACGPHSRALSARRDLRLRRTLCGLPVKEADFPRPVSDHMKSLALKAFQKAVGVH